MKIPYATAKTRWRRAYELIYGKKYDPREVRRENKGKADKLCAECEIPNCYKEKDSRLEQIPCAAYLRLAGKGYQREKSMSEKHFMLIPSGETENSIEG